MAKQKRPDQRPTDSELRLLKVLWRHGTDQPLSVRQVLGQLDTGVGYTTVLKLLQIMLAKGLVVRDESERSHRYAAAAPRSAIEGGLLGDLVQRLFDGSATKLVQAAIDNEEIDAEELDQIAHLISNARRQSENRERSHAKSRERGTAPSKSNAKKAGTS